MTLRTPRGDDLARVNAWMADMRVRREGHLWGEPATAATWKERLADAAKDQRTCVWTVEHEAAAVGLIRIAFGHEEARSYHIEQIAIDPAVWGRGIGSDAALTFHRFVFDYWDGQSCAVDLAADNARGLRLAEKIGYREFGRGHEVYYRDGAYADQVWLRLDRATWNERFPGEREYEPFREGIER